MLLSAKHLTARSVALAAPLLAAVLALMVGAATPANAAGGVADSGVQHIVRLDSPAVVRIISDVQGQVICHQCNTSNGDITFPLNGGWYEYLFSGSGAMISPDGYVLTADHVVDPQSADQTQAFVSSAISDFATLTGDSTDTSTQVFQSLENQNLINVRTQIVSQRVFVSTAYTGTLQNTAQVTSYSVTRIVANSPDTKQDTAIIKVEASDLPFLRLAPAGSVHLADSVTAIAFPGDADVLGTSGNFTDLLSPTQSDINTINSLLSPSVNSGQVTAQKALADGTGIYETTAIGSHGSSGGPVVDIQGRVIGIVDTGLPGELNGLIPSDVIAEYTQQAGIANPGAGTFMPLWTRAIDDYDRTGACHWTHAYSELKQVQQQYPNFGAVQTYLQTARTQATPSECPAPGPGAGLFLGIGGVLLLLVAGGVGAYFVLRRQGRLLPATAGQAAVYPVGTPTLPHDGQGAYAGPGLAHVLDAPSDAAVMAGTSPLAGEHGAAAAQATAAGASGPAVVAAPVVAAPVVAAPVTVAEAPAPAELAAPAEPVVAGPAPAAPPAAPNVDMGEAPNLIARPGPVPGPAVAPVSNGAPITVATAGTTIHMCTNGHIVHDAAAHFCPECGARVHSMIAQD